MTGIHLLRAISTHDSQYYPERLQKLFIVNTPGLFARAWGIIKPWLDKGTLEKIVILGSGKEDITKALLEYVDKESLPEVTFLAYGVVFCLVMYAQTDL